MTLLRKRIRKMLYLVQEINLRHDECVRLLPIGVIFMM